MPNNRNGIFLLSNIVFLCIRGSDVVIVIWHAEPSKWNQGLLCCQGIQSLVRKESKPNQVLEKEVFVCRKEVLVFLFAEAYLCLRVCPVQSQISFLFHRCCCKTLKSYWHTNYSCFQTKFHLPSVNNGCALAEENREIWLLPALTHLVSNGISLVLWAPFHPALPWWQVGIQWVTVQMQSSCFGSQIIIQMHSCCTGK